LKSNTQATRPGLTLASRVSASYNKLNLTKMTTKNKLDNQFGPVGTSAGIFLFVAGLIITYFSLKGLLFVLIGAFVGFSSTGTLIESEKKRLRFSINIFGIFPIGQWVHIQPDMNVVSNNLFEKSKGNALTSEAFVDFIKKHEINEFYITGADAIACVKSTVFNMCKEKYNVTVLSDCITSYNKRKIDEMLNYYEKNGCRVTTLAVID